MPCYAAMNDKPVFAHEDQTVQEVLTILEKKKIDYIAIVDDKKTLQGVFSYRELFKNLLPVSIPMAGAGNMSLKLNAPGVAKRLLKVEPLPVRDVMDRKPTVVYPETPTWKGTTMFAQTGEPLFVVDESTGKLLGVVDGLSIMHELRRLLG